MSKFRKGFLLTLASEYPQLIKYLLSGMLVILCLECGILIIFRPRIYGLRGDYYDNTTWQGAPFITSLDTNISTETLKIQRKNLPRNLFSVEWTGYIDIPEPGEYTFFTDSDDGSWLFIDDRLVVDNGGAHGLREARGTTYLSKGLHRTRIRFFQMGGFFVLAVSWAKGASIKTTVPARFFFPPDINILHFHIYRTARIGLYYFLALGGGLIVCIGMFLLIKNGIITLRKHPHNRIVLLIFFLFLALGTSIFENYGFSWDETTQRHSGLMNFNYIVNGGKELFDEANINERYYGPVFEVLLVFLEKGLYLQDTRSIYLMRHFVTFLIFVIGVFCFYLLCRERFQDWKTGLLGSGFLILSPRIFAHAFYNSKDIPFLSLFIVSIYTLVKYLEHKTWGRAFLHAFSCALLIDIRILGIIVPCLTVFFMLGDTLAGRTPLKETLPGIIRYGMLLIPLTILFFPVLWQNPGYHFLQAFLKMKRYPWDAEVFYLGEFIRATELPWHYLPVWISITTPIIYLVLFLTGLGVSVKSLFKQSFSIPHQARNDLLFLLWFFLPLLAVITLRSVVYDAWRHLFFIYPAFLLFALHGAVAILSSMKSVFNNRSYRLAKHIFLLILFLSLGHIIYVMIKYHPYQNVYFNRLAGKNMPVVKNSFELDYWGLSYRQALEYILRHDARDQIKIYVAQEVGKLTAEMLSSVDQQRIHYTSTPDRAEYFVSNYRWQKGDYSYKHEWYSIKIGGAKIIVVYKL